VQHPISFLYMHNKCRLPASYAGAQSLLWWRLLLFAQLCVRWCSWIHINFAGSTFISGNKPCAGTGARFTSLYAARPTSLLHLQCIASTFQHVAEWMRASCMPNCQIACSTISPRACRDCKWYNRATLNQPSHISQSNRWIRFSIATLEYNHVHIVICVMNFKVLAG
jgi:hypothetical protein